MLRLFYCGLGPVFLWRSGNKDVFFETGLTLRGGETVGGRYSSSGVVRFVKMGEALAFFVLER